MSDSGHLILPLDEPAVSVEAEQSAKQSKHDQRLDFVMKCRNGRGQPSVSVIFRVFDKRFFLVQIAG